MLNESAKIRTSHALRSCALKNKLVILTTRNQYIAQKELLYAELATLKAHEDRLAEIASSYEEELDGLSEEDKEADFVNEDKTAFVWPEVKKAIKAKEVEPQPPVF